MWKNCKTKLRVWNSTVVDGRSLWRNECHDQRTRWEQDTCRWKTSVSLKDNEFISVKSRTGGVVEFNVGIIINETELFAPSSIFRIKWLNEFMASLLCKVTRKKNIGKFHFSIFWYIIMFIGEWERSPRSCSNKSAYSGSIIDWYIIGRVMSK